MSINSRVFVILTIFSGKIKEDQFYTGGQVLKIFTSNNNPNNYDLKKVIKRIVKFNLPDSYQGPTIPDKVQKVVFTRTAIQREGGEVKYSDWQSDYDFWSQFYVPEVDGFKPSQTTVDEQQVMLDTNDTTLNIEYQPEHTTNDGESPNGETESTESDDGLDDIFDDFDFSSLNKATSEAEKTIETESKQPATTTSENISSNADSDSEDHQEKLPDLFDEKPNTHLNGSEKVADEFESNNEEEYEMSETTNMGRGNSDTDEPLDEFGVPLPSVLNVVKEINQPARVITGGLIPLTAKRTELRHDSTVALTLKVVRTVAKAEHNQADELTYKTTYF